MFEKHREQEDTSWIRERQRGKKEPPDRKDNNRLLRADIVLDQAKADIYVSEYIEDSGDFSHLNRTEARKAAALIRQGWAASKGRRSESERVYRLGTQTV